MKSTMDIPKVRLVRMSSSYCRVVFQNPPLNLMGWEFVSELSKIMTEEQSFSVVAG